MSQWYKDMVKAMNQKLLDHQGVKKDEDGDFPLVGQDKRVAQKLDNPKGAKLAAPEKKPAPNITMDWIKEQKQKLTQKTEDDGHGEHTARWESKSGKHWVDLHSSKSGSYHYRDNTGGGGSLGALPSKEHAVSRMQNKVDSGYFLPDKAKTAMKRTK